MAGQLASSSQPAVARHHSAGRSLRCSRPLHTAPGPRGRVRARVLAAAAAAAPGQPELPATGSVPSPAPPAAAAEAEAAPEDRKSSSSGHHHLPNSLFVAFPKLPLEGSTLTAEEERCDPYSELCRTPIHVWESRCNACSGTGAQRSSGSSSGSRSRSRGGGRHTRLGVCLLCSGLGYVRHTSNRTESVPYVNGTGPHTTIGRQPPPEQKPRRFQFPGSRGGGKK